MGAPADGAAYGTDRVLRHGKAEKQTSVQRRMHDILQSLEKCDDLFAVDSSLSVSENQGKFLPAICSHSFSI